MAHTVGIVSPWVRTFSAEPTGGRTLVCFPHAGGVALFYQPMSAALRPDFDVLAVQYPGRQDRLAEPVIDSMDELADAAFGALVPWLRRRPVLFGHSMGAIVAFETARRMQRELGTAPAALIASGWNAPSRGRRSQIHLRDDAGILAELERLDGTDRNVLQDEELVRLILPSVRADYHAIETYKAPETAGLQCPIGAFIGDRDPHVTEEDARVWSAYTAGGFDLQVFDGGHFYLTSSWADIGDRIRALTRP